MIDTKKDLKFFIQADYMMNRGYFNITFKSRLRHFLIKDHIMDYLVHLRKYEFFQIKKELLIIK